METVIARDTDVLREYLAALDDRERGLSPFARLAATFKLARLRREVNNAHLETTGEDFRALRHEIDERVSRTLVRRFLANSWGSRISVFLILVIVQQIALAFIWLLTVLFGRFAPVPRQWNPVLPHEQPVFLWIFVFVFFFATPMLALLVLFGGRYVRAWRTTLPATVLIVVFSAAATFLVVRSKETNNPVRHVTSLGQFAKEREVNVVSYGEWVKASWLMNDAKFQHDYELYFRNGPGRWITSRLVSADDAAWQPRTDDKDSLAIMNEYLDGAQDQNGFRDWLRYYLDRNRIYSEDRLDQEVATMTGPATERFLGIWQLEPYLKERDQRLYRAYLGSVDSSMKKWGLVWMGVLALAFLITYAAIPVISLWKRLSGRGGPRGEAIQQDSDGPVATSHNQSQGSFPERSELTTPPFSEEPFKLLSGVHRAFLRMAIFVSILVFAFWGLLYALDLTGDRGNPPSQLALMRSDLLFGGSSEPIAPGSSNTLSRTGSIASRTANQSTGGSRETPLASRVHELEQTQEEDDYQSDRRFREQYKVIASQRSELNSIKSATGLLQTLPEQISSVGSRVGAAEARAGEGVGQAEAARLAAENIQKQLGTKLSEVETRATRAAEQVGKVEDQASLLSTRTEALEKEFDRRARQIEARTEELGERTAGMKEREERVDRLQRIAFAAILGELKSGTDDFERRIASSVYRASNKVEARHDADALRQRITALANELKGMNTDQAKQFMQQLEELTKRVDQLAERVK